MAKINLETITDPISEEQPCGPDLDMEFDMDFMNFIAEIEGMIPTRYFSFDPGSLPFDNYYDQIGDFLERTRDIRILVPLAKLRILQGDLPAFAETLEAIQRLLKEHWSDVHPQPADFLELSMGQLSTLDDNPNVVMPLQHTSMARSRRAGPITLRKWQIAQGDVNPREGEDPVDTMTITSAMSEIDADEVAASRAALERMRDALSGIRVTCIEEAGFDQAPGLEKLPGTVDAMLAFLQTTAGGGDDAAASADGESAESGSPASGGTVVIQLPAGAVANREEAVEAMHAAARYFALYEPSSPVPMLLREAQNASSKSFYELLNELVPDTAGSAFVALGNEPWFEVPLYTLDSRNPAPDYEADGDVDTPDDSWESAGLEDETVTDNDQPASGNDMAGSSNDGVANDAAGDEIDDVTNDGDDITDVAENDASNDGSSGEIDDTANDDLANDDLANDDTATNDAVQEDAGSGEVAVADEAVVDDAAPQPRFVANSRPEAIALLEKVLAYYKAAEPSSPVALILERAIDLSSKSFIELLGRVMPEGTLKVKPTDDY